MKEKKKAPNTVRIVDQDLDAWLRRKHEKTGISVYKIVENALRAYREVHG